MAVLLPVKSKWAKFSVVTKSMQLLSLFFEKLYSKERGFVMLRISSQNGMPLQLLALQVCSCLVTSGSSYLFTRAIRDENLRSVC